MKQYKCGVPQGRGLGLQGWAGQSRGSVGLRKAGGSGGGGLGSGTDPRASGKGEGCGAGEEG